jgi:hypothetical protein
VDDRTCLATVGSDDPYLLALFVGLLDVDFEIVDAPELATQLRKLASRYTRAAGP